MTGGSLGSRTGSYGSLQQQTQNGAHNLFISRTKSSKLSLSGSREKDRIVCCLFRYLGRRKVGMLILVSFALLAFIAGFLSISREEAAESVVLGYFDKPRKDSSELMSNKIFLKNNSYHLSTLMICGDNTNQSPNLSSTLLSTTTNALLPVDHPCQHFAFPPPPIGYRTRVGPRHIWHFIQDAESRMPIQHPALMCHQNNNNQEVHCQTCPVCYVPVEHAIASMPNTRSSSALIHQLTYFHDENPIKDEPHGGSDFGGYPSLKQRNDSFTVKESMTIHCGFIRGCRPGQKTGFDIDVDDLKKLEEFHDVIVASAIFGNYDIIQEPLYISKASRENVPFYMFIDEETEAYMKNTSALNSHNRVGLWRIIVVRNVPYADARRNGKVPKLLLHRLFPNVRYSIWIDGKLQLVADPYQILERFLWRQNATFAISRHYRRFDVFEEAEANKAAGKYDNSSIDYQIGFYEKEGLTRYSEAKLPITSDVPEGCVIIKEHTSITNLFTCLWFNEVDRFTSRDQLSFSTVRDKLMSQVKNWSINMFMDCERRNFVKQSYHKELLEHLPHPPPPHLASVRSQSRASAVVRGTTARRPPLKKGSVRRGRKSGSRRNRKVVPSNTYHTLSL